MKKGILFFVFVVCGQIATGQFSCTQGVNSPLYGGSIDSTDFSGKQTTAFHFQIDTTLINNIWQIGSVSKTGFPASLYGGQAIQTDTLNTYGRSNTSAFMVWSDSIYGIPGTIDSVHSLTFWHYYDVDSSSDSCIVQLSKDSGITWLDYATYQSFPMWIDFDYNIPSFFSPYNSDKFLWSGKSVGWQKVQICFSYPLPVSPGKRINQGFGFRFLFKSDSVQTNKPGWIIDKINFKHPILLSVNGGVKDYMADGLSIFPNPSYNGLFEIDFPTNYVTGKFHVYDYLGRNIKTVALKEQLDLSDLPKGLYSYKAVFEKTNQWFSGKIESR